MKALKLGFFLGTLLGMGLSSVSRAQDPYFEPHRFDPARGLWSHETDSSWHARFGVMFLHPRLFVDGVIVVENAENSSLSGTRSSAFSPSYQDVLVQWIQAQKRWGAWSAVLSVMTPLNGLANIDTGYQVLPEFVLYRSRLQQPAITTTLRREAGNGWAWAGGLDLGFSAQAQATVFLQAGAGRYSDQRLVAKAKPSFAGIFGLEKTYDRSATGLTVRTEKKSTLDLDADTSARVFTSLNVAIDYAYTTSATVSYEPWMFDLWSRHHFESGLLLTGRMSFQLWSLYQAPAALIGAGLTANCNGNAGCTNAFSPGVMATYVARNILVPSVALEYPFGGGFFGLGYRYRPSIFAELPRGFGNYLDPDRHDFTAFVQIPLGGSARLVPRAFFSGLVPQTVEKLNSTEIGAPGYTASGSIYGGSIEVSFDFEAL